MEKEENKSLPQNEDQEELSNSEFGFVYEFFMSESKGGDLKKKNNKEKKIRNVQNKNQSIKFFLPDFFTDDD